MNLRSHARHLFSNSTNSSKMCKQVPFEQGCLSRLLTSHGDDTHVSSPAVHFRAEEPVVLIYRVTFNAAKWVA